MEYNQNLVSQTQRVSEELNLFFTKKRVYVNI